MPNHAVLDEGLNQVLKALADPTRRSVVQRLGGGPATTTELAEPFRMALPSFTQHLDVLERSGLVSSTKDGRVRTYRLEPAAVEPLERWLDQQRALWERRLDRLDRHLLAMEGRDRRERRDRASGS
jgi:DNA-binding transcriptional ArsR family regulator